MCKPYRVLWLNHTAQAASSRLALRLQQSRPEGRHPALACLPTAPPLARLPACLHGPTVHVSMFHALHPYRMWRGN